MRLFRMDFGTLSMGSSLRVHIISHQMQYCSNVPTCAHHQLTFATNGNYNTDQGLIVWLVLPPPIHLPPRGALDLQCREGGQANLLPFDPVHSPDVQVLGTPGANREACQLCTYIHR